MLQKHMMFSVGWVDSLSLETQSSISHSGSMAGFKIFFSSLNTSQAITEIMHELPFNLHQMLICYHPNESQLLQRMFFLLEFWGAFGRERNCSVTKTPKALCFSKKPAETQKIDLGSVVSVMRHMCIFSLNYLWPTSVQVIANKDFTLQVLQLK